MRNEIVYQRNVNVIVPFIKVFLAYSVAMQHFMGRPILVSGGMSVDLFFIISGFFLANSFSSKKYESVSQYSLHRIQSFYKQYIVAFILLFAFTIISAAQFDIKGFLNSIVNALPEVLLLQNVGWFDGGINYPLWFLCDLVVVSHILFALLKNNEHITINVICPIIVLLFGAYYANVYGDYEVLHWGVEFKFLYIPLFRTACFLSIGIMLFHAKAVLDCKLHMNNIVAILLFLIAVCFFVVSINTTYDYIPFLLILLSSFYIYFSDFIYDCLCHVRKIADDLTLVIFFNHVLIIKIMNAMGYSKEGGKSDLLVFLCALTLFCIIIGIAIPYGVRAIKNKSKGDII